MIEKALDWKCPTLKWHDEAIAASQIRGMWAILSNFLFIFLLLDGGQKTTGAPSVDWSDRYLDKEYAAELYNLLQNYLNENNGISPLMTNKRNSEIINSLLALPKSMSDVGR
ncbi:pigment-dispersing factor [Arctopsyche grandis]|uniref:pigment-dispersing factor n=1 Tax=Arctopsyche grandis TaxID=121162 RepID=UPI00406D6649